MTARIRVWAPEAQRVDVALGADPSPTPPLRMEPERDGWWTSPEPVAAGTDYAFILDGSEPALPDPRSPWQPQGVHGASRTVDHSAFAWSDTGFRAPPLASAVIYELHVGTFSEAGTFESAIEHLDHLVDLGVTHVELLPVNTFAGERGWGYDGVDLYAPHQAYGGPEGLKRLVDALHGRGLAAVLDVVYNHFGPAGNYLPRFGPYLTDKYRTPWGDAVNYDAAGSDEVRRFVVDNALMWLRDYHFDALRLDAVHAIVDTSAVHLLEQLADEVERLSASTGRPLALIAESDLNDPRIVRSRDLGGYGMDAQWSDDFHHVVHTLLTGEQSGYYEDFAGADDVAHVLRDPFLYAQRYASTRDRRHGRRPDGIPGHRFLGYIQNHDQIGNRAVGERISHLVPDGRARIGAALVLTAPYVPMLFMGEEWAASTPFQYFTDHEPELGKLVSEGRRSEFGSFGWDPEQVPDPQERATFERSRLRWDERSSSPHREMLEWHRALIRLRRSEPDLLDGHRVAVDVRREAPGTFLIRRGNIAVAFTIDEGGARLALPEGHAELVLASADGVTLAGGGLVLQQDTVAVLRLQDRPGPERSGRDASAAQDG